ncbi:hypothetical protein [Thiomicrorhabdus xiamenensis]|nr:hypothetical protein [Thiomicrorhabdus xiamenensis]
MSNNNENNTRKNSSLIKYGIIGALLLVAPIVLVNQIVAPMLSVQ